MGLKKCCFFILIAMLPYFSSANNYYAATWVNSSTPIGVTLSHQDAITSLYHEYQYQPIWFQYDAIVAFESQLENLALSDVSELFYKRLMALKEARYHNRWQEFDVLATDTLLNYISYTELAQSMGKGWFFGGRVPATLPLPSEINLNAFRVALSQDKLVEFISALAPQSPLYSNYQFAIRELKPWLNIYLSDYTQKRRYARRGDKLSHKRVLLNRLEVLRYDVSSVDLSTQNNADKRYDTNLEVLIKQFQTQHGLEPDGIIGPKTIKWINVSIEERLRLIALNAQRLRIWPLQRDRIVLVNVPQYSMSYWLDGKETFSSDVIVGRPSRKTPLIDTRMDSVIVNPSWNVPRKIMEKDILPKVINEESYLTSHNYEIVESWHNRTLIDPKEIDWASIDPKQFPYRMRQTSGPFNALGKYKFNTPNKNAIFLHDTPAKSLFTQSRRAFSSGCIRIESAENFAHLLLNTHSKMRPSHHERISREETVAVALKERIPVSIIYQTVWTENGQVQYRSDVYKYDQLSRSSNFDAKLTNLINLNKNLSAQ
ncbi:L,D-transpeptidase family protein [Vibrio penaeicida]|uniref:L,D-transpeptidase family protein n=1 Tax=Vibrio penaeicida TaxID=104609 RepID=UPI002732CC36|nr:L,D-transpeptidase family protein [Vibrio penaeicida]MDP2570600.1 L,D-transpeptidase family protein [Vibrio penaeicida]